jgi:hypothetical protein
MLLFCFISAGAAGGVLVKDGVPNPWLGCVFVTPPRAAKTTPRVSR